MARVRFGDHEQIWRATLQAEYSPSNNFGKTMALQRFKSIRFCPTLCENFNGNSYVNDTAKCQRCGLK